MLDYCLIIIGFIASVITIVGFLYGFLRNFKLDINSHIDRLEKRMDRLDNRMDQFEIKINSLEERMFWLATGKTLTQAILEEKMKQESSKPKTNP